MNELSSNELINKLMKIQDEKYDQEKSKLRRIFISIITPEWFYSNSTLLDLNSITWERLEKSKNFMDICPTEFDNINTDYEDRFEKSFSSWYQPYHILRENKWGIHIRIDSIKRIAKRFFYHNSYKTSKNNTIINSFKSAFIFIYFHHLFHNLVENITSIMEIKYNIPIIYLQYYSEIYSKTLHSSFCLEEFLANIYLIERMKKYNIDKEFLENYILELKINKKTDYFNLNDMFLLQKKLILQIQNNLSNFYDVTLEQILEYINSENNSQYILPIWIHKTPKPLF